MPVDTANASNKNESSLWHIIPRPGHTRADDEEIDMTNDELMTQLASLGATELALLVVLSLPPLFVLMSKRVAGGRKFLWFVLTSIFSWLAYVPFVLMTKPPREPADQA